MTATRYPLTLALLIVTAVPAHAWQRFLGRSPASGSGSMAVAAEAGGDVFAAGAVFGGGFQVFRFAGADGATRWTRLFPSDFQNTLLHALATAPGGDVYAGASIDARFGVARVAGADGGVLWTSFLGTIEIANAAAGVSGLITHASGDVIAAGRARLAADHSQFAVARFAAGDGGLVWSFVDQGDAPSSYSEDMAFEAVVDGAGDVVAVGRLENAATGHDLLVVKLAGASGTELWRVESAIAGDTDGGTAIAIDAAGDVAVGTDAEVIKLAGASGAELWRIAKASVGDVAIAADGDVVAGDGFASASGVHRLDAATGDLVWAYVPATGAATFHRLAIGAGDRIFAAGRRRYDVDPHRAFAVVELDGATGSPVWQSRLSGNSPVPMFGGGGLAWNIALDSAGRIVAGGSVGDPESFATTLAVAKLQHELAGNGISYDEVAGNPSTRKLRVRSTDGNVLPPGAFGATDPVTSGATLALWNPATLEATTIPLPAAFWSRKVQKQHGKDAYRYKEPGGPCRVDIRGSKVLSIVCKGAALGLSLDEPGGQGSLAVKLRVDGGEGSYHCLVFGGTVTRDVPALPSSRGSFKAKGAPAALSCPAGAGV